MSDKLRFDRELDVKPGEVEQIAPGIRMLVAPNPGPFTFKGTNSYIVGEGEVAVIDPGPDIESHRAALLRALKDEKVTHIFLTHTHRDHSDGMAALVAATGAKTCGYGPTDSVRGTASQSPSGRDFVDHSFFPDNCLRDGDRIDGASWALEAVHTPGHAPDHLCFAHRESSSLFTGDHIMGWNTSVIAPPEGRMTDYMRSLELLLERDDSAYWPGHGAPIRNTRRQVRAFLMHRKWRESAIFACLKDGPKSIGRIVPRIYETVDGAVEAAAALSVLAHLELLVERGRVSCEGPPTLDAIFSVA